MNYLKFSSIKKLSYPDIVRGKSQVMRILWEKIEKLAPLDVDILIVGETGTGKEIIAREIHNLSKRRNEKFVPVHTAGLPENLFESELFGFKKGAFTGAIKDKKGYVHLAHKGTLFLDEIGDAPSNFQVKLLRFIETKKFFSIGGEEEESVDTRIILATNKDLNEMCKLGKMREDLYYRISKVVLNVPPLRERREDIPLFVDYFIQKFNLDFNKNIKGLEEDCMDLIMNYSWPGNIRELGSVIEQAVIFADDKIRSEHIVLPSENNKDFTKIDREKLVYLLKVYNGNINKIAINTGIERKQIYRLIERYKIEIEEFRK
jgi:two-component system response regulator PilR (NtrC family)